MVRTLRIPPSDARIYLLQSMYDIGGIEMTEQQAVALAEKHGYHCVVCGRFLPADEYGVIVHDDVPHPTDMDFNDEEKPQ